MEVSNVIYIYIAALSLAVVVLIIISVMLWYRLETIEYNLTHLKDDLQRNYELDDTQETSINLMKGNIKDESL